MTAAKPQPRPEWTPDICLYHDPCDDGFAAAWAVRQKWGDDVTFIGTNYGQHPKTLPCELELQNVLVVDFSYKPDELAYFADRNANKVVILDHHKTAETWLQGIQLPIKEGKRFTAKDAFDDPERFLAIFNQDKSGAMLAWEFCFDNTPPPWLIRFVEDRDLWRFQYPETRVLTHYIRSFPREFDAWDAMSDRLENRLGDVLQEAHAIARHYDVLVREIAKMAVRGNIGGYSVPIVHAPHVFASDVADAVLSDPYLEVPFVAVVVKAHGGVTFSLRSRDNGADVSEVAKKFGGGGHRNAAGFRMPAV